MNHLLLLLFIAGFAVVGVNPSIADEVPPETLKTEATLSAPKPPATTEELKKKLPEPNPRLSYLYYRDWAENQDFIRAQKESQIALNQSKIAELTENYTHEQRIYYKGFGSSIRVAHAKNALKQKQIETERLQIELEIATTRYEIYSTHMKEAEGQEIELTQIETLYDSLLKLKCKREKTSLQNDTENLNYAEDYLDYLKKRRTGISPAEVTKQQFEIEGLQASIKARMPIIKLCENEFGDI